MNTTQAVCDFFQKSGMNKYSIDRAIGVLEGTVKKITLYNVMPRQLRLLRVQEYLVKNGYVLDELQGLPKEIIEFRALYFEGKVFLDVLQTKMGFKSKIDYFIFLEKGETDPIKWKIFLDFLNETKSNPVSVIESCLSVQPKTKKDTEIHSEDLKDDAERHLSYAIFVINTIGAKALKDLSREGRVALRKNLDSRKLFEATNILSALSSEKAYELQNRNSH